MQKHTTYRRCLGEGGFLGVDFTSAPYQTDPRRLSECVNLWHDWQAEMGGFLETFPGFRCLCRFEDAIFGIFAFRPVGEEIPYLIIHAADRLYVTKASEGTDTISLTLIFEGMAKRESSAFTLGGQMGILDWESYRILSFDKEQNTFSVTLADNLYTPITYADNQPYEQRNALCSSFKELWHLPYTEGYGEGEMGNLLFEITSQSEKTCRLVGAKTKTGMVRVPSTAHIDGQAYRVTEIGDRAFQNDNRIELLVIEEGIETVGRYAFNTCLSLEKVSLPSSLTHLKKACFAYCENLRQVHFGEGLLEVGDHAFYHCPALCELSFGGSREAWEGVVFGESNEALADLTPTFDTASEIYARCYRLTVHEKCKKETAVKIGEETLLDQEYALTSHQTFQPNTTYYTALGNRFLRAEVTVGETVAEQTYYQKRERWYSPVYESFEGESLLSALYIYALDGRNLPQSQCTLEGELSETHFSQTEVAVFGKATGKSPKELLHSATLCTVFDGRVFLAGAKDLPSTVFYSQRTREGLPHPGYFGVCNYMEDGQDGIGFAAICATPTSLFLFKKENAEEGVVYCHTPKDTDSHLIPRIYPATAGGVGSGAVGPACHFADDTVYLSRKGLEATDKSTLSSERGLSHRSYFVDGRLCEEALSQVRMVEWQGYLLLLCPSGRVYMADSRLPCRHKTGEIGYEWVCLEGIGGYENDLPLYRFAGCFPFGAEACFLGEREVLLSENEDSIPFGSYDRYEEEYPRSIFCAELSFVLPDGTKKNTMWQYAIIDTEEGTKYYLLAPTEERTGGTFSPAKVGKAVGDLLYLGTEKGHLLIANTDKRGKTKDGTPSLFPHQIDRHYYHICRHRIPSLAVTVSDNAEEPTVTKSTMKKSTVMDTKALPGSRMTVAVSTDQNPFLTVGVYTEGQMDFGDADLFNFVFLDQSRGQAVFSEHTKRWGYKRYAVYSHDYQRPFGIGQISYRFRVEGRMKPL